MKKQIKYGLQFFYWAFISMHSFSQTQKSETEKFDIITYIPPKHWKKDVREGVVNYTAVNNTTGSFCVIAMYASSSSAGDAEKDFKREWKELVITPYKAEDHPKTEKKQQLMDGKP